MFDKKIREDAKHFDMPAPDFPLIQEIENDLTQYEQTWSLYEQYSNELNDMASQDWISFR